jgi:hypothetical protein
LRINKQTLSDIVDSGLDAGLLFLDLGVVYRIEFGVSLQYVSVDKGFPLSQSW